MTTPRDHDVLDLLLADPPPMRADLGAVVVRHALRRRRRRLAAVLGVAVLAGGVATTAVLAGRGDRVARVSVIDTPTATPSPSAVPTTAATPAVSHEMAALAAAVRTLADEVAIEPGHRWSVLYVLDQWFDGPASGSGMDRPTGPIAPLEQTAITVALDDYAPVRFVRGAEGLYDDDGMVRGNGVLVMLGPVEMTGTTRARLELSVQAGGKAGRGATYELTRTGDVWTVTSDAGPAWIS